MSLEALRADADHVALGALDLAVDLGVVDAGVVLRGELLAADVAGVLRRRGRVVLADVVHEAVLALAHHAALRALFVALIKVEDMVAWLRCFIANCVSLL